jgi:hypothetical protein
MTKEIRVPLSAVINEIREDFEERSELIVRCLAKHDFGRLETVTIRESMNSQLFLINFVLSRIEKLGEKS